MSEGRTPEERAERILRERENVTGDVRAWLVGEVARAIREAELRGSMSKPGELIPIDMSGYPEGTPLSAHPEVKRLMEESGSKREEERTRLLLYGAAGSAGLLGLMGVTDGQRVYTAWQMTRAAITKTRDEAFIVGYAKGLKEGERREREGEA